ncbi:MAG: molybdate ABC transporter substrate-binding protein [Gammaproteobacteria bacterium]
MTAAVAANFRQPMSLIAESFEQQTGHLARLIFGSSGKFFAQINQGAPFDLFFSADQAKPAALVDAGLANASSRITYAIGSLVLWSPRLDKVDDQGQVLREQRYRRLAIANPALAPYGEAAMQVVKRLSPATAGQLIVGENVAQAYQFVSSGNAELGLLARSQVYRSGELISGSAWSPPSEWYTPIRQDAVLLTAARENPAAQALMAFMVSPQAREVMHSYGYRTGAEQ